MPRGHKDYGDGGQTYIIHSVTDMGELASRLGSPDVFQRSGNVVFITSFESGIDEMVQDPQGTGSAINLMGDRCYSGGLSVRLIAGSDGGRRSRLTKRFHTVETNKMGVEATFSLNDECTYFSLFVAVRDGTTKWSYGIYASIADGEFQYYDNTGNRVKMVDFDWGGDDLDHWHTFKLVFDLALCEYVRAFYNEVEYDLTGISVYQDASADDPRLDFTCWNLSEEGENGIAYVDNVIVTINEP